MPTKIYRPRAAMFLTVPLPGHLTPEQGSEWEELTYEAPVKSFTHTKNDHNTADTLTVEVDWLVAGVDPRWIAGATCEFYLGNADDDGQWQAGDEKDLRFVGRLVRPTRKADGNSLSVSLEFHDYTSFFLLAKRFATAGIPRFSDDLAQAWARLCAHVPGAEELGDNIRFVGLSSVPKLGDVVAERFRHQGAFQIQPGTDAWAIWQLVCGAAGLISYIDLDECVVTTALDYYTQDAPPTFLWGRNLASFDEARNNDFALKPVGITSFDPVTGTTLEAIHDPLKKTIKVGAKKRGAKSKKPPKVKVDLSQVDFFSVPGVTSLEALHRIAERVYEERSRQAMEGSLSTVDMTAASAQLQSSEQASDPQGGAVQGDTDLLFLRAGDMIEVRFMDSADADFVKQQFESNEERAYYLEHVLGYSPQVARVIAANVDRLTSRSSHFYVRSVTSSGDFASESPTFKISVQYINKIDISTGMSE